MITESRAVNDELVDRSWRFLEARHKEIGSDLDNTTVEALKAVQSHMAELLSGQSSQADRTYRLASLDPGKGKTEAVCMSLKAWKALDFKPTGGVLVCLSRIREIEDYISRAGLAEMDFAVVSSDKELAKRGCPDPKDAPVLFTTQEQIYLRSRTSSFLEMDALHFQGRPRALRIWDETATPARCGNVRMDDIVSDLSSLRHTDRGLAELIDALAKEVSSKEVGDTVRIPESLKERTALAGKEAVITQTSYNGRQLIAVTDNLPADFAPAIILDASGRVRETYRAWEKSGGKLVRLPEATNDYSALTIHHWNRAASRSALQDSQARSDILQAVADLVNADGEPAKPWLVIHPKPRGDVNVQTELFGLIDNAGDRLRFCTWGDHHGTNEFRDIEKVVVLGLLRYDEAAYLGYHLAASGGVQNQAVSAEDITAIEEGEHKHHLLQAICRSSVRKSTAGSCGACTVYIVDKSGAGMRPLLEDTFPGAAIREWSPVEPELRGQVRDVAEELERHFSSPGVISVRKADVRKALELTSSQGLAQVLARPAMQRWLRGRGLSVETRQFVRLAA